MFTCGQCGKQKGEKQRVFAGSSPDNEWCRACYNAESKRSIKEDMAPGSVDGYACFRTRPPKYMLQKSQYKQFGYDQDGGK